MKVTQNMPLWHKNYFELKAINKDRKEIFLFLEMDCYPRDGTQVIYKQTFKNEHYLPS